MFLKHIIKCSAYSDPHSEILYDTYFNTNNLMITSEFAILLKQDSKSVVYKVQIHSLSDNLTYYKYNTYKFKVCRFDFLQLILLELQIDCNRTIQLRQDNI